MTLYRSDQLHTASGIKALIYGRSGVGKTSLVRSLMHTGVCVADAESGTLSIANTGCAVYPIKSLDDFFQFVRWVKGSSEARQFGTFFVDTMTEIAEQIEAKELPLSGKEPRRAYNEVLKQMTQHFRDLRDLQGPNVVFLAQENRFKDDDTGGMIIGADFPGFKLGPKAPRFVDEVFRLYIQSNPDGSLTRVLRCQPSAQADAKDRSGLLQQLEPADLGYIFNKLNGAA